MTFQGYDPTADPSPRDPQRSPRTVLVTGVDGAYGSRPAAAALACEAALRGGAALFIDLGGRALRPTLIASRGAREVEESLAGTLPSHAAVASRGRLCWLWIDAGPEGLAVAAEALALAKTAAVVHLPFELLEAAADGSDGLDPDAVLLRAEVKESRWLLAGTARALKASGLDVAVQKKRLSWVGERRAMFGALRPEDPDGLPPWLVRRLLHQP